MSIRSLLFTAALVLCLPFAAHAADSNAADRPATHRAPRTTSYLAFLRDADLTIDQNDQLHQLYRANAAKLQPMKQQLRSVLAEITDQLSAPGAVDSAQLASLEAKAAATRQEIDAQWLTVAIAARALLTPEQLSKVSEARIEQAALHRAAIDTAPATAKP